MISLKAFGAQLRDPLAYVGLLVCSSAFLFMFFSLDGLKVSEPNGAR